MPSETIRQRSETRSAEKSLDASGRREDAVSSLRASLDRYERKEIIPLARHVRDRLAAVQRS
jgi:hypothetical protein